MFEILDEKMWYQFDLVCSSVRCASCQHISLSAAGLVQSGGCMCVGPADQANATVAAYLVLSISCKLTEPEHHPCPQRPGNKRTLKQTETVSLSV